MVHTLTIGLSPYRTQITWHCTGCYSAWQFWAHAISCPSCKLFAGYTSWNRHFLATLLLLPNREKLKSRSKILENQSQAIHRANRGMSGRKGKKIQNQRRSKIIVNLNTNDFEMTFVVWNLSNCCITMVWISFITLNFVCELWRCQICSN